MSTAHQTIMKILCGDWQHAKLLQIAVNLVLILFIASSLAGLTWKLFDRPEDIATVNVFKNNTAGQNNNPTGTTLPTPEGESFHLFGRADQASMLQPQTINAPETNLNLELRGVIGGNPQERALAVISQKGHKEEEIYGVDDRVPGNALIKEIYHDRVLLSRAGILETLPLKEDGAAIERAKPAGTSNANNWRIGRSFLTNKLSNVGELAREVGVEFETQDNAISGYRLISTGKSDTLQRFGLQSGDIIAAVNGINLTSMENGLKVFKQINDSSELLVVFERDGKRMTREYFIEE